MLVQAYEIVEPQPTGLEPQSSRAYTLREGGSPPMEEGDPPRARGGTLPQRIVLSLSSCAVWIIRA